MKKKRGRPPSGLPRRVHVSLTVPGELHERVQEAAAEVGLSASEIYVRCAMEALPRVTRRLRPDPVR